MQFNTFVSSINDLEKCVNAPNLQEILLQPIILARQGQLSQQQLQSLASAAIQHNLRPVLVWDILMPEKVMSQICQQLTQWDMSKFSAVRVCDPGAAWWLKTHYPTIALQLIVETGNHNLEALRGWCDIFSDSLERLILSIELPEQKLIEYCQTLPVGCEILGVGQILLFYSPRSLLSPHLLDSDSKPEVNLQTTVSSEDSNNRPFPTVETVHGTFMFLDKDQFILDKLDGLEQAGLDMVCLDLRHLGRDGDVAVDIDQICSQVLTDPSALRKNWPRPTRSPFFNANRTTSIFSRMKSKHKLVQYREEVGLAEVLAGESGNYVVFQSLRPFAVAQVENLIVPTGEEIEIREEIVFRNLNGEVVESCDREQILITDWIKKAMPGSLLLGNNSGKL
ncbi:MAG: U32 family peptidase [Microcoleaceae cyanobacterium]